MHLRITRPLIFLDLETTGTNTRVDRIVEIAAVKLHPDGRRETWTRRLNPQRPIPAEAAAIHGITDADVATAPTFTEIAFDLQRFLANADFAGFGIMRFDLPLLSEEFRRAGTPISFADAGTVDVQKIYFLREPRTLSAALQFYCGKEHTGAHSAHGDVLATIEVLEGQLSRYDDLPREFEDLKRLCLPPAEDMIDTNGRLRWRGHDVIIAFGQKSGSTLRDMVAKEPNYLRWMLNKDFPDDVKDIIRNALEGRYPQRQGSVGTAGATPPAGSAAQPELALE